MDNSLIKNILGQELLVSLSGDDILNGNLGDDIIDAQQGNDTIWGNAGNDSLIGNVGNDVIFGGKGKDTIYGGNGDDKLRGQEGNDTVYGGAGNDFIEGNDDHDFLFGGIGLDTLFGGNGDDTIDGSKNRDLLRGQAGNDRLIGGNGGDALFGDTGKDTLYGGDGNDQLQGGNGNDQLLGGIGDDILDGGLGFDVILGGQGRDLFVLRGGNGSDNISDFQNGIDKFILSGDLTYQNLQFVQQLNSTQILIQDTNELLATLKNISSNYLDSTDFINEQDVVATRDLTVQFRDILETPSLLPNESGKIEIIVTNFGINPVTNVTVGLYASSDRELDKIVLNNNTDISEETGINLLQGTDEFLGNLEGINLKAGESKTFLIDFASSEFNNPSCVSLGVYNLIAAVDPSNNISEADETNNLALQTVSVDGTDVVLDWNSVFMNIVQTEGKLDARNGVTLTDSTVPGVAPPVGAHDGAILHLAVYEAINAFKNNFSVNRINLTPTSGASVEAAAMGAAYGVLSSLYPQYQTTLDFERDRSLAEIDDTAKAEASGYQFGLAVAQEMLALRANDGSSTAQIPYTSGTEPGDYQESTIIDPETGAIITGSSLLPGWGQVTPFALPNTADFRPSGPPEYGSEEYLAELEQIRHLGGLSDTELTEISRTEEQTEIAQFWAYDRIDTFRPFGQWYEVAQQVSLQQGNTLEDNALLFAELSVAMADAGIVAWDTKYIYQQARPVQVIQDLIDPNWQPLLTTPPFPDYISGHATFGGAAAGVLEDFFGNDVTFEMISQELPGVTRVFTGSGDVSSFEQAALENANSRLYGGVHWNSSNIDGLETGLAIADYVVNNYFV